MANNPVIKLVLIVLLSILPSLISVLILRSVKQRWQARLRRARWMTAYHSRNDSSRLYHGDPRLELERYFIGDINCRYNARSPYIRCAINPSGPCQDCTHYEPKNAQDDKKY